jgi:geranylgeranyl diphosphate synthase type I
MHDQGLVENMRIAIDDELRSCVDLHLNDQPEEFKDIISYQMGWESNQGATAAIGKRLRPLLLLLTCHALNGDWRKAVPAAAALELIHNFSLVHDDIQDQSLTRRGKETIWVRWGEAQAINMGDAILALANLEILTTNGSEEVVLSATNCLQKATFALTSGQYLDLAYEKTKSIRLTEYWKMVEGKTGALFSACFELGALLAGKRNNELERFALLGKQIGMAFQVQDDFLGIWGDDQETGKSSENDLVSRKKTYPILYALEKLPGFRREWISRDQLTASDIQRLKNLLVQGGVKEQTKNKACSLYETAMTSYSGLFENSESSEALTGIIKGLFQRMK